MSAMSPREAAERAVAIGGAGTVAVVRVSSEAEVRWANSMLTTNGERVSSRITVMATAEVEGGTGVGVAGGSVTDASALEDLVRQARTAAAAATAAPDAEPLVTGVPASADWAESIPTTSGAEFTALAAELADAFARGRADGVEHFGYAEHEVATTLIASATGLRLRHTQPTARVEATAKSGERTRSAWAGRAGRDLSAMSVPDLDAELRRGLAWQERQIDLAPGRHDAILTPSAISDLLVYQLWSSSLRDAADGRTVFSRPGGGTRLGESVAGSDVTLSSDPFDPELLCAPMCTTPWSSPLSSAFDLGLPLQATRWVDGGALASLVSTRHSAAEAGVTPTPMVDNLRLELSAGHGTLDDLVARTDRAVLITCLWYIREVDPRTLLLTGLTRDGVYLVEGGEVVGSVGNYRFNDSPVDVLGRLRDATGAAPTLPREWGDYFTRAAAPGVVVEGFNLSTRSDAL